MEPPPLVLQPEEPNISDNTNTSEPEWVRGATDAKVTIDTYPDFECHACIETQGVVVAVVGFYPRNVKMVYHHYPLSEWGQTVAEALEAAGEQGKFWELHDRILEGIEHDIAALKQCAEEVGLDIQALSEALDSHKFMARVVVAKEEAVLRGVEHATVFINGREYHKYPPEVVDVSSMVADELEKIKQEQGL